MKKRLVYITIAAAMALSCSIQAFAEPMIKKPSDATASASSEPTAEEKSKADQFIAPPLALTDSLGQAVTDADVAAVLAMDARLFYSIPGDNHDGTLNEERKGMDFRRRVRQPFEFFPYDVYRLLAGYCKFDENGKLREYDAAKGTFWGEETEAMWPTNRVSCYDSWTIAWFDKNDSEYLHLNALRNQLEIVHPPKNDITFVTKVVAAIKGEEMPLDSNSHISTGLSGTSMSIDALGVDPTVCAICGRKRT